MCKGLRQSEWVRERAIFIWMQFYNRIEICIPTLFVSVFVCVHLQRELSECPYITLILFCVPYNARKTLKRRVILYPQQYIISLWIIKPIFSISHVLAWIQYYLSLFVCAFVCNTIWEWTNLQKQEMPKSIFWYSITRWEVESAHMLHMCI